MEQLGLAMHAEHERDMRDFAANVADLVTLFIFIVLGANIPFEVLGDYLLPALAVIASLLLVARPADGLRLHPPGQARSVDAQREAVPLLDPRDGRGARGAGRGAGRPRRARHRPLRRVVALAVILTLILQALPAGWLAGRLGLIEPASGTASDAAGA